MRFSTVVAWLASMCSVATMMTVCASPQTTSVTTTEAPVANITRAKMMNEYAVGGLILSLVLVFILIVVSLVHHFTAKTPEHADTNEQTKLIAK